MKHVLISRHSDTPGRFLEAFPKAKTVTLEDAVPAKEALIWFKLQPMVEIQPQIEQLKKQYQNERFIVLTSIPNIGEAVYCLQAGARAYCNVHAGPATLKQIGDVVAGGGVWVGEELMQYLVTALGKNKPASPDSSWREKLSQREIEVVEAIAGGASNKVVARALDITERTVKAHVAAVFEKLGVRDRLKLVLMVTSQ